MADTQSSSQFMADGGLADVSAVVSSLPLGYSLGMERFKDGVTYRLCYNNAGDLLAGMVAAPIAAGGPYTVTVSTVALAFSEFGAVVRNHAATATSGSYFWGARKGSIASGLIASAVCVPSGTAFYLSTNGNVVAMPQSVVTGISPIGMALTTILSTTSGGGRNGSAIIDLR